MVTTIIKPTTIGNIAAETIKTGQEFTIRGITSRGIFVLVDGKTIVFLSRESFKGPLIVNMPWDEPILDEIDLKSTGRISNYSIQFDDLALEIQSKEAGLWSASSQWPPIAGDSPLPAYDKLVTFAAKLLEKSENELLSAVLSIISKQESPSPEDQIPHRDEINKLYQAIHDADVESVRQAALYFAGRGRGLTPSGDDFLLGIVYGLNQLQQWFNPDQIGLKTIIAEIVGKRSTLISANLVDCAALGEVDERIGNAFSALLDPTMPMNDAVFGLSSWGSSSGIDAAAGFLILMFICKVF